MSTTPMAHAGDNACDLCGRLMGSRFELEEHLRETHDVTLTDGTGSAATTPAEDLDDTDDVEQTEGGAGRVQTE